MLINSSNLLTISKVLRTSSMQFLVEAVTTASINFQDQLKILIKFHAHATKLIEAHH